MVPQKALSPPEKQFILRVWEEHCPSVALYTARPHDCNKTKRKLYREALLHSEARAKGNERKHSSISWCVVHFRTFILQYEIALYEFISKLAYCKLLNL